MKFGAWMVFAAFWAVLVYFPVAHWVFAFDGVVTENSVGGWIVNSVKVRHFAGGTAVHINAGAAALAVAIALREVRDVRAVAQAAQRPPDPAGRRPAVGRLVRVQRRFGIGRGELGRHRHGDTFVAAFAATRACGAMTPSQPSPSAPSRTRSACTQWV
jgi:hypothetical protein